MKKRIKYLSLALATTISLNANEIEKIQFDGLSRISEKIALETININNDDNIDIAKINASVKKFYEFGYFDDVYVTEENGILTYHFKEKPSISNIEIEGYKTRTEDKQMVLTSIGMKKGSMYTEAKVEKAKDNLLKELEKDGFVNSVVEIEKETINEKSVSITFFVNKGEPVIIEKVNYIGSDNLDAGDFEDVTANKEKEFMGWFYGRNDGEAKIDQLEYEHLRINDLYYQKGYLDSKVKPAYMEIDFNSNKAELDFSIEEGEKYTTNTITIYVDASIIDPQQLKEDLKLTQGKDFNIKKLREDVEMMKTAVGDLGYAFADIKYDIQKDQEKHTANIVYNIIPGEKVYINDVQIKGNSRTLDRVIRRNVYMAHGDLYSQTDYKDSINKLKRTGYFENVEIQQKRLSPNLMDLVVNVKEAPTGNIVLGGGYGSYDGMLLNASVNDRNVFGSGLGVGVSVDWSKRQNNYQLSLTNPAINDSSYNGSIEVYNKENEIEYDDYELNREINGFAIGAGKELFRNFYAGLKYKLEDITEDYDPDDDISDDDVPEDQDYILSSITPYVNFDNTDDYNIPRNGIKAGTSLELAGVGGDAEFAKSLTYFKYFYGLESLIDKDWIIRYRAKVNMLFDMGFVTQGETFYLGGPSTVRGYESYAFGPDDSRRDEPYKNMFANSIEVSFPLIPSANMRWGLFYDYGMIGEDSFSEITRSGTGALFEWISPVGPLQLIFSKAIGAESGDETSSFEFSLGSKF